MPLVEGVDTNSSLLQADDEYEVLYCIREAVDDVLQGFLCVGEKGAVVSKTRWFSCVRGDTEG